MTIKASTPEEYMQNLSEDRISPVGKIRQTILKNLPKGFEEGIGYGMLSYHVPKSIYPDGYHCDTKLPLPFMNVASQKNFIALYHMGIYANPDLLEWFVTEFPKHSSKKLDMGKSCVRFKKMEDIPFDLIGELVTKMSVQDWVNLYEKNYKK
ncbi:MAG: DUF1801 domain-containing protein [Crocinitomicaceae bacterium]|jgi:hypothetical protein|nr:DUF1801 domain-containing protein [Crocinitomicaceae bacterium]MDG2465115.1 DUF1801 domain-containing protein [Crocinitomicaceae bacterium]